MAIVGPLKKLVCTSKSVTVYVLCVLQMPDVVNTAFEHQLYATSTSAAAPATTTSGSCVSELVYDESDGSESATPDMDSQLLYVKLKEVHTTTTTTTTSSLTQLQQVVVV